MTDFYTGLAAISLRMIDEKGRNVTHVKQGTNVYSPSAGTFTAGTETETTVKAVFTDFKLSDIDGELIRKDDKMLLIAASSLSEEPTTADKIKESGIEWTVVAVNIVKPADTALLYKLQVRR
jgi:deoxyxylulose-5-phosphate synthase